MASEKKSEEAKASVYQKVSDFGIVHWAILNYYNMNINVIINKL